MNRVLRMQMGDCSITTHMKSVCSQVKSDKSSRYHGGMECSMVYIFLSPNRIPLTKDYPF